MSSAAQPKIFGIRLGVDPKILVGALIAIAVGLFWWNSRGDEPPTSSTGAAAPRAETAANTLPSAGTPVKARTPIRRGTARNDRGTIRLRSIDPTRGDVDPVLRLDLLTRLLNVQASSSTRNLFEGGSGATLAPVPVRTIIPKMVPTTAPVTPTYPVPSQAVPLNIPLKYYGFAKPATPGEANQGFFLDGDNILVAAEGQLVKDKYLVVQITPTGARMEDTQVKQSQTLPVVPEALDQ